MPLERTVELDVEILVHEIVRMMDAGANGRVYERLDALVASTLAAHSHLVQPRGTYELYDVDRISEHELKLRGCPSIHGPIAAFLRPRVGQKRLELVRMRPVEEDQRLVYIPQPLWGRHVVGHAWIKGPEVAVIGKNERIGIFNLAVWHAGTEN